MMKEGKVASEQDLQDKRKSGMNFTFASFEGTKREREEEYLSID
jgi:hypothetical protein